MEDPVARRRCDLGVTFTFVWIDEATGLPTDVGHNRKADAAFREIYYSNAFTWSVPAPKWSNP